MNDKKLKVKDGMDRAIKDLAKSQYEQVVKLNANDKLKAQGGQVSLLLLRCVALTGCGW